MLVCVTLTSKRYPHTNPVISKPTPSTVFNLQASNWVYCEEETSAHTGISQQNL